MLTYEEALILAKNGVWIHGMDSKGNEVVAPFCSCYYNNGEFVMNLKGTSAPLPIWESNNSVAIQNTKYWQVADIEFPDPITAYKYILYCPKARVTCKKFQNKYKELKKGEFDGYWCLDKSCIIFKDGKGKYIDWLPLHTLELCSWYWSRFELITILKDALKFENKVFRAEEDC